MVYMPRLNLAEPDSSNVFANYVFPQTGDTLVINNFVANDHAIDDLRRQVWQDKPVLRIVSGKRRLANQHGFCWGRPEYLNVVGVFDDEALKVMRVVRIELALHRGCWIHQRFAFAGA